MSDVPRLMNVGGMLVGPTPPPPAHLQDIDSAAADAAWRQSHGSLAAYYQLLEEHKSGTVNLLSKNPMRITAENYKPPFDGPGDARLTDTGGAVVGGEGGVFNPMPPGEGPAPQPTAEQVSPLSEAEREMLAEIRAKPEGERTAEDDANLRALSDREEALGERADDTDANKPLTTANKRRLTMLRNMPDSERTPEQNAEMTALAAREGIE